VSGSELWISDGTTAGTTQLADINPGEEGSHPVHPFVSNGALYFFAYDFTTQQTALMRLASGASTPTLLAPLGPDITPPASGPYAVVPCQGSQSATLGTQVFFAANDGQSDLSLWTSDGTPAGTHQVRSAAGVGPTLPCAFTVFKNRVFFLAGDSLGNGNALWSTDGTAAGTVRITNAPRSILAVMGDSLYFAGRDNVNSIRLWKTDGTAAARRSRWTFRWSHSLVCKSHLHC